MTWVPLLVRYVALVTVLHLPSWSLVWLMQGNWTEERPVFNLDLMLAAGIACFSTIAGGVALLAALAADLVRAATKNYHFLSVIDFVDSVRFVDLLNYTSFVTVGSVLTVLALATCFAGVLYLARGVRELTPLLAVSMILFVGLDAFNGSSWLLGVRRETRVVRVNLAGSPLWNILAAERQSSSVSGPLTTFPDARSYRTLVDWREANPHGSALVVIVESLGMPTSKAMQSWLFDQLQTPRLAQRWTVRMDRERFVGATTSGELRVLCGLAGHYSRLTAHDVDHCAPVLWRAAGGDAIGLHGFHLSMFNRRDWWPRIGLTAWRPDDDVVRGPRMNCNEAFPGVCDDVVLDAAVRLAVKPERLVYALTLDTHLPLPARTGVLPARLSAACEQDEVPDAACEMVWRLGEILAYLEHRLAATRNTPLVIIVGDHAPPFGRHENRRQFQPDGVPVFILEPVAPTRSVDSKRVSGRTLKNGAAQ